MQIRDGLALAGRQLTSSEPQLDEAVQAVGALVDGTQEVVAGSEPACPGSGDIEDGVRQGAAGAAELHSGVQEVRGHAETLRAAYDQLSAGYEELAGGIICCLNSMRMSKRLAGIQKAWRSGTSAERRSCTHPQLARICNSKRRWDLSQLQKA